MALRALPPGFAVRIVPLRFVGAAEMQRILEPFAVAGNIIRVDVARNLLILAGTRQELNSLLDTIQIFDVDWLAGMSVALFTPSFVESETLAAELSNVFGDEVEGPLAGLVRFVPIERLNALLVVTPRKDYLRKVSEWVDRLDQDSGSAGRRLYVYHVQNGKAVELAEVLNQVFESEETDRLPLAELAPGLEAIETQSEAPASQQDAEGLEGQPPPPPIPNIPSRVTNTAGEGVALSGEVRSALFRMSPTTRC